MSGTVVTFAEVGRYSWRRIRHTTHGTGRRYQGNITHKRGNERADCPCTVTRVLPLPAPPVRRSARRITTATESWKLPAIDGLRADAAVPVTLHLLSLLGLEQGVGHESVAIEDGVVLSRHGGILAWRAA